MCVRGEDVCVGGVVVRWWSPCMGFACAGGADLAGSTKVVYGGVCDVEGR